MMFGHRPTHVTIEGPLAAIELWDSLRSDIPPLDRLGPSLLTDMLAEMLEDPRQELEVALLIETITSTRPRPEQVHATAVRMLREGTLHARFVTAAWVERSRGWEHEEPEPLVPHDEPAIEPGREERPRALPRTWVSFEVVDDHGRRANGSFRVALDARVVSGQLEQRRRSYGDLRQGVDVRVRVDDLWWSPRPSSPLDPAPPAPNSRGTEISFEVVDDDGHPMAGSFELEGASQRIDSGDLHHRGRVVVEPEDGPFTLSFPTLRSKVHR